MNDYKRPKIWQALVIWSAVMVWFILTNPRASSFFGYGKAGEHFVTMESQLRFEALLAVCAIGLVLVMGWAYAARMNRLPEPGALWWLTPPLALSALIAMWAFSSGAPIPAAYFLYTTAALVVLVGVFEEIVFRGMLLSALETRMNLIAAVLLSSLLFGVTHYVNLFQGQSFSGTTIQVLHSTGSGVHYAALMLVTGSIWAPVLVHSVWDAAISMTAVMPINETAVQWGLGSTWPLLVVEPMYGALILFVVLRHRGKTHRHETEH